MKNITGTNYTLLSENSELFQEFSEKIKKDKIRLKSYIHTYIKSYIENNTNEPKLILTKFIKIQFGSTSSNSKINSIAKLNKLSVYKASELENKLSDYYNIGRYQAEDRIKHLMMSKVDYDSRVNYKSIFDKDISNSVVLNYYHPDTSEKLDLSILPSNTNKTTGINFGIPMKNPGRIRMKQNSFKNYTIDYFNSNDTIYSSQCKTITNSTFESDTTINSRRERLFNGTAKCTDGCEYKETDKDDYLFCDCDMNKINEKEKNEEVSQTIGEDILNLFPKFNFGIVECYDVVYPKVCYNITFYNYYRKL